MNSNEASTQEPVRFPTKHSGVETGSSSGREILESIKPSAQNDRGEEVPTTDKIPDIKQTDFSSEHLIDVAAKASLQVEPTRIASSSEVNDFQAVESDRTIVSAAPIAEAQEFYPTGSVASLAQVLIGQQLDHYQLYELVGGGGMGAVFKASDTRLDRIVAVKVIPNLGRDQESLKRFRVEAQSAAKLDHPNIARVYYVGETQAWSYIVFEFIEGVNLRDLVVRSAPISIDDAIYYTVQIAQALQHASDRGVVHRDIKPSNALVTSSDVVKVVDMGLARTTSLDQSTNDLTASGVTLGTFDYISPEQARDPRAADVRSDLYSLGCTLYYLLVGRPPYHLGTAIQKLLMHGETPPEDPRRFRDDIPNELVAIIRKLMSKRPRDRYQQPSDLIIDLQLLAGLLDLPKSQSGRVAVLGTNSNKSNWIREIFPWLVGLACLLISSAYLYYRHSISGDFAISQDIITKSTPVREPSQINNSDRSQASPSANEGSLNSVSQNRSRAVDYPETDGIVNAPGNPVSRSSLDLSDNVASSVTEVDKQQGMTLDSQKESSVSFLNSLTYPDRSIFVPNNDWLKRSPPISEMLKGVPFAVRLPNDLEVKSSESNANYSANLRQSQLLDLETKASPVNSASILKQNDLSITNDLLPRNKSVISSVMAPRANGSVNISSNIILVRTNAASQSQVKTQETLNDSTVVSTLSEAIRLANTNSDIDEIWLDDDQIRVTESILITRSKLTIRATTGSRCRVEWRPESTYLNDSPTIDTNDSAGDELFLRNSCFPLLRLENTKLLIVNLDFQITVPEVGRGNATVAMLGSGSQIRFSSSVVTMTPSNLSWDMAFISITSKPTADPPQIDFEDVIVRGTGNLISMETGVRSEIRWRNGLLAITGRLLDANGATSATKTPPTIRMDLQDVTVDAQLGLARIRMTANEPYPICVSRDARNCTFICASNSPLVSFEGVSWKDAAELQTQLLSWIDLRGADNAYDEKINALVRLDGMSGKSKQIGFEASSLGIFSERAPETSVRWLQTVDKNKPFDQRSPQDYLQQATSAFRSGMKTDILPPL